MDRAIAYARYGNLQSLNVITITEAGKLLNLSNEEVLKLAKNFGLTKIYTNDQRFMLDKEEVLKLKNKR
jgi:hypothetical protein